MNAYRKNARIPPTPPASDASADADARFMADINKRSLTEKAFKVVGYAFVALLIPLILGLLLYYETEMERTCANKGGTWLSQEGKCISGREIK